MKRVLSIICAAVLLVSLFCLSACGNDNSEEQKEHEEIHATYQLVKVTMGQNERSLKDLGYENGMLEIDGDTAKMSGFTDTTTTLTVNYDEEALISEHSRFPYSIEGSTLTLKADAMTMVFEEQ